MASSSPNASEYERVRKSDNPVSEAANVLSERAGAVSEQIGATADEAMKQAGSAMTRVREKGGEAVNQAVDVVGNFRSALETSARSQPGTTMLMALATGFIFGLLWRSSNTNN